MHSKATNVSKQKGWKKKNPVCSRFISLPSWLEYAAHPCGFLDPDQNSLTVPKSASAPFNFWKSVPPARVLEAAEFTADGVNFIKGQSHRLSVLWHARTSRRQNFSLFQSHSALGQINTRANKPWALVRWRESCSLLGHSGFFFRPHIHKERHIFHCMFTYICTGL